MLLIKIQQNLLLETNFDTNVIKYYCDPLVGDSDNGPVCGDCCLLLPGMWRLMVLSFYIPLALEWSCGEAFKAGLNHLAFYVCLSDSFSAGLFGNIKEKWSIVEQCQVLLCSKKWRTLKGKQRPSKRQTSVKMTHENVEFGQYIVFLLRDSFDRYCDTSIEILTCCRTARKGPSISACFLRSIC